MRTDTAILPVLAPLDARIPRWSIKSASSRPCPFCGAVHAPALVRPDGLPVAFCAGCQLWYVSDLPPSEEIERLYQGYWFSLRPKDLSASYAHQLLSFPDLLEDDIRLNRLCAVSGGLRGKRLLEIGCGCGEFLVAARHRGAEVFGNDISDEACSFLTEHLSIPVFHGQLDNSTFRKKFGSMDLVVMSDLIEHPVDPLATFASALNVLKPGGLLLILTPNGGNGSDQWTGFRVDLEHLQYLSSSTIAMLAGPYDCRIEHLESFGYPDLERIDRLPAGPASRCPSWRSAVKTHLRKWSFARRLRRAGRAFYQYSGSGPGDPRSGTYHLLAILRKMR